VIGEARYSAVQCVQHGAHEQLECAPWRAPRQALRRRRLLVAMNGDKIKDDKIKDDKMPGARCSGCVQAASTQRPHDAHIMSKRRQINRPGHRERVF
jgi:hypothetical protein